jgi:hypothetical protein
MTRDAAGELKSGNERDEYIRKMSERPSRTLMSSGGNTRFAVDREGIITDSVTGL